MSSIAKIIVDIALDREFDYLIPDGMAPVVKIGTRVLVPFGHRQINGYVVGLIAKSDRHGLKQILSVVDEKPFLSDKLMELARWIADYYCASVEASIRSLLPGAVRGKGKGFKKRLFVALCGGQRAGGKEQGAGGEGGARLGSGRSLLSETPKEKARPRLAGKEERGGRRKLSGKQKGVVELLKIKGGMFLKDLTAELGITAVPVKALEKKGVLTIAPETEVRNPLANKDILRTKHLTLMPEQESALKMIIECVDAQRGDGVFHHEACSPRRGEEEGGRGDKKSHVVLLHGVTGSGKTEVYLQAIDYVLGKGQGAIVLVPEIALTPQTVERFVSRFGKRIAVLHSHLSDGERHDEWHRIRDGKADIVIGARSAVFAPVKNLGLIVVDEEHEPSYKQEDVPRYNARDVATMRGHLEGCTVVLGSATPALESWYNAKTGKYLLATLPHRADDRQMPHIRVVDMRLGKGSKGRTGVLSQDLVGAIQLRLDRAEQIILFLNRRGFATSLICEQCGYVANCDQCSVSYTYHRKDEELRCHICGGTRKVPQRCPSCKDPAFKYSGIGTQRIESIVKKCFPQANVQRIDADMTRKKDSYERILGDFRVGKTDILIGTQM
ncbi:MAG: primosomal protein N', partial [Kiritimatiellae bacterium]|nr:primosomal protein N' [Kiritimatiellia bacterium]